MSSALLLVAAVVTLGVAYVIVPVVADTYARYRSPRVVVCPETDTPEEIAIDAPFAAISAAFGNAALEVSGCSRWPANGGCARACLAAAATAPRAAFVD